ncbi:MAG: hypothetical protein ABS46_07105 [Cytophagaceae bacterium SCN 52-12]|nr:MAG: hypothetical protein ABS46_07105 [Cytophagaceae bacterium SCN 52-12]
MQSSDFLANLFNTHSAIQKNYGQARFILSDQHPAGEKMRNIISQKRKKREENPAEKTSNILINALFPIFSTK